MRFFLLFLCSILSVGYSFEIVRIISSFLRYEEIPGNLIGFMTGVAIFVIIWLYFYDFWRNWMGFFTHELTHAISCMMSSSRVLQFVVNRGRVSWVTCERGNVFISLSPYFLPIFSFIPVALIPFIKGNYFFYLYITIGFTTMYHLTTFITQFRSSQPDLQYAGFFTSTIYVVFGNIFFTGLILGLISDGYRGMWKFVKGGWILLFDLARKILF
ncbi:MAG: hypothetical protein B6244_09795 [Candidatus Cloacimonetes bacterium 4572_55]|nr:MAG: hypothetical protein B6244_09795 [Candidatus Cloacimonetes bacterium 4572_55]